MLNDLLELKLEDAHGTSLAFGSLLDGKNKLFVFVRHFG